MLSKIEGYLRSYLSFPDDRYFLPLALFAILEHCWDECFDEVPYLAVSAMVKGAGKTRVLELLSFLAGDEKAILVDGSVTVAALYTEIDEKKVILIDEVERLQNPNSPFRPILNGGYRRGQVVLRRIGRHNVSFSIFCPKVFAQIGDLNETLRDRCLVIEMQRTMAGNRKEYVRQEAKKLGNELASEMAAIVLENVESIRDSYLHYHDLYPSLSFLRDRDREIWKPLFALCQVFAPERLPELERSAIDIATLKTLPVRRFGLLKDEEEKALKLEYAEHLLRDALAVIGDRDRITTADLVKGLRDIGTSPWRTYEGTGITDISLAAMLKLFGIEPKTIRVKPKSEPNSTAKGYRRADMAAGTAAAQAQPDVELSRNPPTHSGEGAAKPSQPEVEPDRNPVTPPGEGDSGCSLTTVCQEKPCHLEPEQVKSRAIDTVSLQLPALNDAPGYTIHHGDVLDILPTLPSNYFSGSLSDLPYEIGMMGRKWDSSGIAFSPTLWAEMYRVLKPGAYLLGFGSPRTYHRLVSAIEEAGFEIRDCLMWMFGTGFPKSKSCLKSGYEPIVLARKPAKRGLPLAIESCRINPGELVAAGGANFTSWRRAEGHDWTRGKPTPAHNKGRYPTNLMFDEGAAAELDAQTGKRAVSRGTAGSGKGAVYSPKRNKNEGEEVGYGDSGGVSRYFYCPKASRKERDAGLGTFPLAPSYMVANGGKTYGTPDGVRHERTTMNRNCHPTVKPIALDTWLAKLILPEDNGRLLVPFSGSGSEMIGGLQAGWDEVVGVEISNDFVAVAEARLNHHCTETQAVPTKTYASYIKQTPPTFSYPGGKARMAKLLVSLMPPTGGRYLEPFAGRGNVFWVASVELDYREWHINDIRTAPFFKAIQTHGLELVVPPNTRMEYLERWAAYKTECPYAIMLEPFLTYSGGGFGKGGFRTNEKGGAESSGFQQSIRMAHHILNAVTPRVTAVDWVQTVKELGPDDFAYFDPPYLDAHVTAYSASDLDHRQMVAILREAKYRWLLSEYDHPLYREAFGVPLQFPAANRHGKPRTECVWANYPFPKTKRCQ